MKQSNGNPSSRVPVLLGLLKSLRNRFPSTRPSFKRPAIRGRVATKLIAGFVVVLALTGFTGWLSLRVANTAGRAAADISEQHLEQVGKVTSALERLHENRVLVLEFVVDEREETHLGTPTALKSLDGQINQFVSEAETDGASEADVVDRLKVAWGEYVRERDTKALALAQEGHHAAARETVLGSVQDKFVAVESTLHELAELERDEARELSGEAQASVEEGRQQVIAGLIGATVLGLVIALWLARRISRSMRAVTDAAEGLAEGDLSRRADVRTHDEIETMARAFNSMAERLESMMQTDREIREALESAVREYSAFADMVASGDLTARVATNGSAELSTLTDNLNNMVASLGMLSHEVRRSAHGVGAAAGQILGSVSEQSATVTQQSTSINETSVTVEELRASAEQAAQRAVEVADQAQRSVQVGSDGNEVVGAISGRMEDIRERVEAIAQNILTLSEQTQQIGDITATVDDIAEQSNLLALNATIEAARAGEHGRGFAVVAAEVRSLAEQSKQGTAQVRSILSDIQKATNSAVMATEQGIRVVEDGRQLAHRAGDAIEQLAQIIGSTAQSAQQISAATRQQSLAIDQISESMQDINHAAAQFVTGVDESKSAAEGLDDLARELQALTQRYKV